VVPRRILERQRALLLQDDEVPRRRFQCLLRRTRVPMTPQACAACRDDIELDLSRVLGLSGDVRDQARQLVARRVAVADEQDAGWQG